MISDQYAAQVTRRLARHTRTPSRHLTRTKLNTLWALLDTNSNARAAFQRPSHLLLEEHAATFTAEELDNIADTLAGTREDPPGVEARTPVSDVKTTLSRRPSRRLKRPSQHHA
jgi:hypothetical protein